MNGTTPPHETVPPLSGSGTSPLQVATNRRRENRSDWSPEPSPKKRRAEVTVPDAASTVATTEGATPPTEQPPDCPICLSSVSNKATIGCDHVFCLACIREWSQTENSCPLCKTRFESIVHSNDEQGVATMHVENVPTRHQNADPAREAVVLMQLQLFESFHDRILQPRWTMRNNFRVLHFSHPEIAHSVGIPIVGVGDGNAREELLYASTALSHRAALVRAQAHALGHAILPTMTIQVDLTIPSERMS